VAKCGVCKDEREEWVWKDDKSGSYIVKSAYAKLNNELLGESWKSIRNFGSKGHYPLHK